MPPPARKRRSEGLPPSEGKAPRPPCGEGFLSITQPLRHKGGMKEKANSVVSVFSRYCGYSLEKWVLKEASGPGGFFGVNFCGG
ncbi:hypothetical protein V6N13_136782 [Hibiscus sabdariffa]